MTLDLDRLAAQAQKALDRPLNDNRWGLGDKLPTPRETLALVAVAKAAVAVDGELPKRLGDVTDIERALIALRAAVDALREGT